MDTHTTRPDISLATTSPCRVCGCNLKPKWQRQLLGRYVADYHECLSCGCLQIPSPHWLEEAYRGEGLPQQTNPDSGRFCRNFSAYVSIRALALAGLFGTKVPIFMDYGGGSGILTAMLRGAGFDCRQHDPYCPYPMLEPEASYSDFSSIPEASFDAITSLEVFEHLLDPVETIQRLQRLLRPNGTVILSTGLYDSAKHGFDWPYLACPYGQHVTFYTRQSILYLAQAADFPTVCLFPSTEGFLILLTRQPRQRVHRIMRWACFYLRRSWLHSRWTVQAWDVVRRLNGRVGFQAEVLP